jgi:molecular chaperone HtpG
MGGADEIRAKDADEENEDDDSDGDDGPASKDTTDFTAEWTIRDLVRRYSDFVEYPIRLEKDTLNTMKPLWARPKAELEDKDYKEFYRHLTHDWNDPLEIVHFRAEGASEYTALLYVPSQRPLELFDENRGKARLSLYVKRVFITNECEELLPGWLRFVRGVVEASDLPLNVSREVLQSNPHVRAIRKRLTRKVLDALAELRERDAEAYSSFWKQFGAVLKEGICVGEDEEQRIAKLCLFESSAGEEPTTFEQYVARMKEGQEAIWYITGKDRATVDRSPHLELFRAKGQEVLYFLDPVDEWMIDRLSDFDGKPLRSIHGGDVDVASDEEREHVKQAQEEASKFLTALSEHYGEPIKDVRFSPRLIDSPGVLVTEQGALRPNMDRFLKETRHMEVPKQRILELNPDHPLIGRMREMHGADPDDARVWDYADLLYGQALLAEGSSLPDPARFSKLVAELMVSAG